MLALSLSLSLFFAFYATFHLFTRNTRLQHLSTAVSFLQNFFIPALLLLTLNLYSSDRALSPRLPSSSQLSTIWNFVRQAPGWWEVVLRTSSPMFVILEGVSTLLGPSHFGIAWLEFASLTYNAVIQAISRFSMSRIEHSRNPDLLQLVFLVAAALVYVVSAYFLWEVSYRDPTLFLVRL